MSLIRMQPLSGPAVWKGADFERDESWIHRLTADEVAEIDAGLAILRAGLDPALDFSSCSY